MGHGRGRDSPRVGLNGGEDTLVRIGANPGDRFHAAAALAVVPSSTSVQGVVAHGPAFLTGCAFHSVTGAAPARHGPTPRNAPGDGPF